LAGATEDLAGSAAVLVFAMWGVPPIDARRAIDCTAGRRLM